MRKPFPLIWPLAIIIGASYALGYHVGVGRGYDQIERWHDVADAALAAQKRWEKVANQWRVEATRPATTYCRNDL